MVVCVCYWLVTAAGTAHMTALHDLPSMLSMVCPQTWGMELTQAAFAVVGFVFMTCGCIPEQQFEKRM